MPTFQSRQKGSILLDLRLRNGNLVNDQTDPAFRDDVRDAIANLNGDNRVRRIDSEHGEEVDDWVCAPADNSHELCCLDLALHNWISLCVRGNGKAWTLGFGSALMIVSGYYGELVVTGDLTPRWRCWGASMLFFLYIVYELLVGLAAATNLEEDPEIKSKIKVAQVMTVISWCTYPVVYLFPMLGINAASAVVSIQIGYCASDIISKCGVGIVIYQITAAKSAKESLLA